MQKHGEIKMLMLSFDFNHRSKGFGFVYYVDEASVQKAIDNGPHLYDN